MRTHWVKMGVLPLVMYLASLTAAPAQTQAIEPPPVKMGLWQTESSTAMAGMPNAPGASKHTTVTQGCLTPETWKSELEKLQTRQDQDCKTTNTHQDAHSLSVDETCTSPQYQSTMHLEMLIDSSERIHGTGKVHIAGPAFPQGMNMDFALSSHYLGASCGDIKPGGAKVIHE